VTSTTPPAQALQRAFGSRLRQRVDLGRYTSARTGGLADFLVEVRGGEELKETVRRLWDLRLEFRVLGGGSNVLVADEGVREVIVLNQAKATRFDEAPEGPRVWAESGASLGGLARRSAERGWSGLEWAASVPGTVGGAVVGNAGAHGGDVASTLLHGELLLRDGGDEVWPVERFEYGYRSSWLKRHPGAAVVTAAEFAAHEANAEETRSRVQEYVAYRQQTQPPGASWGSMFKNPAGDYAGRLIEAAGLKGESRGEAQISPVHANFFVNRGGARAADVADLLRLARLRVQEQTGVRLDLEIELIGEWPENVREELR
jgi:UDP-N-acetylmuramate dehydrogenase